MRLLCLRGILVAVEFSGFIWTSKNYGLDWSHDNNNSPRKDWYAVTCSGDGQKMASGEYLGNLYISLDAGTTWNIMEGTTKGRWVALEYDVNGGVLVAADSGGYLHITRDDGDTWTVVDSLGLRKWQSVAVSYDGRIVYGISTSTVYKGVFTSTATPSSSTPSISFRPTTSVPSSTPSSSAPSSQPSTSLPSSTPSSSLPTFNPSCGIGSAGHYNDCSICPPGSYTSSPGSSHCVPCPLGFYSANVSSTECLSCIWPTTSYILGSNDCLGFYLNLTNLEYFALYIVLTLLFFITIFNIDRKNRLFATILIVGPVADYITDLLFLCSTRFYRPLLFWCILASCLLPAVSFSYYLSIHRIYPRLWYSFMSPCLWLGSKRGLPTVYGNIASFGITGVQGIVPGAPFYENIISVRNCLLLIPIWMCHIFLQSVFFIPVSFMFVGSFTFSFAWFLVGILFFQMKCFVSGNIWNCWLKIWTNDVSLKSYHDLDISFLQEALFSEFFLETIPQLFLQIYNGYMTKHFSFIAILSLSVSLIMAIYGIIRIVFFFCYMKFDFYSVPMVPQSVGKALYVDENENTIELNPMLSIEKTKHIEEEAQIVGAVDTTEAVESLRQLLSSSKDYYEIAADQERLKTIEIFLDIVSQDIDVRRMSIEQLRELRGVIAPVSVNLYDRIVLNVLGIDFGGAQGSKMLHVIPNNIVEFVPRLSSKALAKFNSINKQDTVKSIVSLDRKKKLEGETSYGRFKMYA